MRTDAPRLHWVRLLAGAVVLAGGVTLMQVTSVSWGAVGITAAIVVVLVAVMGVLNLVGPFLIGGAARRKLARARTAEDLIAARGVLESPAAAWRWVSGVGLASFIAVPAGSVLGFLDMVQNGDTVLAADQLVFFVDIRTVVIAAVAVSYLLVACTVGITQAASVRERRALYVSLDRVGHAATGDESLPTSRRGLSAVRRGGLPAVAACVLFATGGRTVGLHRPSVHRDRHRVHRARAFCSCSSVSSRQLPCCGASSPNPTGLCRPSSGRPHPSVDLEDQPLVGGRAECEFLAWKQVSDGRWIEGDAMTIEVQNLSKRYGDRYAVRDVSFTVQPGASRDFSGRTERASRPRCARSSDSTARLRGRH